MQAAAYVILINLAVLATAVVGLHAAWRRDRSASAMRLLHTAFALMLSAAILAVAISVIEVRVGDTWLVRAGVPSLLHVGLVLLSVGILRHYRAKVARGLVLALAGLPVLAIALTAGMPIHDLSRIASYSLGGAMACLLPVITLSLRGRGALDTLLAGASTLLALQFAIRPLLAAGGQGPGSDVAGYLDSEYAMLTLTLQTIAFVLLVGALTLVLLRDGMSALERRSQRDPLTGLLNRRGLEEHSAHVRRRASGARRLGSVVVGDLDRFKSVNDRFGHAAGDAAIRAFSDLLGRAAGQHDLVARIGGEEFVVVLGDVPHPMARLFAEGVRTAFAQTTIAALGGERLTASLGVAEWHAGERLDDAIARADAALYEAKRRGRDRVVVHARHEVGPAAARA